MQFRKLLMSLDTYDRDDEDDKRLVRGGVDNPDENLSDNDAPDKADTDTD